jgi:hypothetical protein
MDRPMMTRFVPAEGAQPFGYSDTLVLMGSCFATSIGEKLLQDQFQVIVNPFGIVYNPLTMALQLDLLMDEDLSRLPPLYFDGELYHAPLHHGVFSHPDESTTLDRIERAWNEGRTALHRAKVLILTWGHTDVYVDKQSGTPVANCHKRPANHFELRTAALPALMAQWERALQKIKAFNPDLRVILTVSPVRYLKRGMTANTRSKATLHLLADHLGQLGAYYFPAFEILHDELRDYRFYDQDLIHPSPLAVDIIYEHFMHSWHMPGERPLRERIRRLNQLCRHRSLHPGTPSDLKMQQSRREQIAAFRQSYPAYPWMFDHE